MSQKLNEWQMARNTPGRLENARNKDRKVRNWNTKGMEIVMDYSSGSMYDDKMLISTLV